MHIKAYINPSAVESIIAYTMNSIIKVALLVLVCGAIHAHACKLTFITLHAFKKHRFLPTLSHYLSEIASCTIGALNLPSTGVHILSEYIR